MTAPMIRADAPELLALVEALEWAMSHVSSLPMDEASQSEFLQHRAALAAWEAIAPKPTADALTPWGIQPDGSGLDPATLPIHLGGKARDDA